MIKLIKSLVLKIYYRYFAAGLLEQRYGEIVELNNEKYSKIDQGPYKRWATKKELINSLNEIDIYLQDLSIANDVYLDTFKEYKNLNININLNIETTIDLSEGLVVPYAFSIKNKSDSTIRKLKPVVNGKNCFSIDSMINYIIPNKDISEKEKAFLIYNFVKNNRYHGPPPSRTRDDNIIINPVCFFNFFGYGLCGYTANNFAVLCEIAGLKSRVWNINGHTLPEVHYDNSWHILDPDAETFFPDTKNPDNLLGVCDVVKDPEESIRHVHMHDIYLKIKDRLISWFKDKETNKIVSEGKQLLEKTDNDTFDIAFDLIPNEEITFYYNKPGAWYYSFNKPKYRAIASDIFNIIDSGDKNIIEQQGIVRKKDENGGRCFIEAIHDRSYLIYKIEKPYPVLDGFIKAIYKDGEDNNSVQLYFKIDNGKFYKVCPLRNNEYIWDYEKNDRVKNDCYWDYRLRRVLYQTNPLNNNLYLKILLNKDVKIYELNVKLILQISPFSLPDFQNKNNNIKVTSDSSENKVLFNFYYKESNCLYPDTEIKLKFPQNNSEISIDGLGPFEWNSIIKDNESYRYHFILSDSPQLIYPIAPNFERVLKNNKFYLNEDDKVYLIKNKKYYWKTRIVDINNRPIVDWSGPFCFSTK